MHVAQLARTISAAASSCRADTGANTLVIATPSAARMPRNRAMAAVSNGTRSRPSNSIPPSTMTAPAETAAAAVARPAEHRPDGCVAGPPILITAARRSGRRSSTALVACVVPSITWLIRAGSAPGTASTASRAAVMPPVMSGVPGTLALASTRSAASRMTASVLVPPTSMPRRQFRRVRHRRAPPRAGNRSRSRTPAARPRRPARGPPERMAGERDHRDPLAVPEHLGGDRVGGLAVQHRNQVGHRGEHAAAFQRDQVLVLQLQPDQPACVRARGPRPRRCRGRTHRWCAARRPLPCR